MEGIIETIIKERDDYRIVKCENKDGNKWTTDESGLVWATNITYYDVECKNCDYVQHSNQGNIVSHLKIMHDKEFDDQ